MKVKFIAIDGASRRNGYPDCVSAGGIFIAGYEDKELKASVTKSVSEYDSTSQRGELLALLYALKEAKNTKDKDVHILTDSEYVFNGMTKTWFRSWAANGWITSTGSRVKNKDIWEKIHFQEAQGYFEHVSFYHIKGHVIPFGKVTADRLLEKDPSGQLLYREVKIKLRGKFVTLKVDLEHIQELSLKNNGFKLDPELFERFVVSNIVADAIATRAVEEAASVKEGVY